MTEELLTIDDIASLYKVSRRTARDSIVKQVGFPEKVHGSSTRKPRWRAAEVHRYITHGPHKSRTSPANPTTARG